MNKEQKTAWLILFLFPLIGVGFFILSSMGGWRVGIAAFSLLGLIGLAPVIFRGQSGLISKSTEKPDERDRQISTKSSMVGGIASYLFFVIGLMGIWAKNWISEINIVPIDLLPLLVVCGWVVLAVVRSAVLLTLYKRGTRYAE